MPFFSSTFAAFACGRDAVTVARCASATADKVSRGSIEPARRRLAELSRSFTPARQPAVVPELGRNFLNQPVVIATFPRQRNGNGCSTLSFTQGAMRWVRHAPPLAPFNWTSGAVIVPAGSWLRLAHADWPDEALRLMHATS